MVLTILEALVKPENWQKLEDTYREKTENLPPEMIQTFLIQNTSDSNIWRIITTWRDREALVEMRKAGTPEGILIFRSVDAEPTLSVFDVKALAERDLGLKESAQTGY